MSAGFDRGKTRSDDAAGNWGRGLATMSVRFRVLWTLLSVFLVECLVFGPAMLPGALLWEIFALQPRRERP